MSVKYDRETAEAIIHRLEQRFGQDYGAHERIKWRRNHYHNRPEADPPVPQGWEHCKMQSTVLRDVGTEMRSRLIENEWTPQAKSLAGTARKDSDAEEAEAFLVWMFSELKNRTGIDLQGGLADGQIIDGYGVLHWYLTDMPEFPEYEELDELPEDEEEAKNYTEDEYDEVAGKSKQLKYRETEDSVMARWRQMSVRAGAPWMVELPAPEEIAFERDKSAISEFRHVLRSRVIGVPEYLTARKKYTKRQKAEVLETEDAPIGLDQGQKDDWMPSGSQWGETIVLKQLWTRDYCYELVTGPSGLDEFECYLHPYGMPSFAIAPGATVRSADPALAYEPMLESLYRIKPQYDRQLSLYLALGEGGAVRRYYLEDTSTGAAMLTESGDNVLLLSADAAAAMTIPSGYTLKSFGGEGVTGDFVKGLEYIRGMLDDGRPGTGRAQFGASTQPWSARIEQAQENIEPKMCLNYQIAAMQVMVQNMMDVMATGHCGDVHYRNDKGTMRSVAPKVWDGLQAEVRIPAASTAERITLIEHGMSLIAAGHITPITFYEEYMGVPNPIEYHADILAWGEFSKKALPGLLQKELAEFMGSQFLIGPDGVMMDMAGQQVQPEAVLQANGVTPMRPPQQGMMPQRGSAPMGGGMPPRGAPQMSGSMGTTPGALPGMQAPGTVRLPGMVG